MYKQISFKSVLQNSVVRLSDNAFIPLDPAKTDYQEYLKWLEEGNTPQEADDAIN